MHEPIILMLFPILVAHRGNIYSQIFNHSWKEPTGMMANLVANSGGNKGQLSNLVETICRSFRKHDDEELQKLVEWQHYAQRRFTERYARRKEAEPDPPSPD